MKGLLHVVTLHVVTLLHTVDDGAAPPPGVAGWLTRCAEYGRKSTLCRSNLETAVPSKQHLSTARLHAAPVPLLMNPASGQVTVEAPSIPFNQTCWLQLQAGPAGNAQVLPVQLQQGLSKGSALFVALLLDFRPPA